MILAHRIELDPTEKQKEYFRKACGTARFVWNWALAECHYRYDLGANTDANEIKRYFNSFKYEAFPWLRNIHRDAHAQPFAALGKAWKAYWKGEVEGRPRFKKKGKCRDSFYVACDKFSIPGKRVRLPVIGQVKLREPPALHRQDSIGNGESGGGSLVYRHCRGDPSRRSPPAERGSGRH